MYLGRYQLGQHMTLFVRTRDASGTPAFPDQAPTAYITSAGGALVATKKMPVVDRFGATGVFMLPLPVGAAFAVGHYVVTYHFKISSYQGVESDQFEIVSGGNKDGAVIAAHWYERPHGHFIVQQTDAGKLIQGRNPSLS